MRLDPTRCYTDWRGMAQAEAMHKDGIEVVSVVTPNAALRSHAEDARWRDFKPEI